MIKAYKEEVFCAVVSEMILLHKRAFYIEMQKDVCVNYVSLQNINCDLVFKSKFVLKCYLIVKLGCQHFVDKNMCFFMIYTRPNFILFIEYETCLFFI